MDAAVATSESQRGLIREGFPEEVNMHGRRFGRRGDREGRSSLGKDEKQGEIGLL